MAWLTMSGTGKRRARWVAVLLGLALAAPAGAQDQAQPYDPDATLVEELVVTARAGGPAFWTVSDGDTTVYVLGVPSVAPKRMQWDQAQFNRRLEGANVVIMPPRGPRVKLAGAPGAVVAYLRLKSGTPVEETLPPEARAKFVAARDSIGQPAKRYGTKNPLAAGIMLLNDYREARQLTDSDPAKLIRLLATQAGRRLEERSYDLGPMLGKLANTPRAAGRVCLDAAVDDVIAGPAKTLAATRAWAVGDVRGALSQERTYEQCFGSVPGAAAWDARIKADQAGAIARALQTPGHAIAVVQLRPLLAKGGVLDRLRAQGFEVRAPGSEPEGEGD